MSDTTNADFGAPIKIDPKAKPEIRGRGGKPTMRPAYVAWLNALEPGAEYEMASKEPDGAHPVTRLNALRKVAKELGGFTVESVYIGNDKKRVRIFAKRNGEAPSVAAAKAKAATKAG